MSPVSTFNGRTNDSIRRELGRIAARKFPVDADIVVPVPDSGISFGLGFSEESGIRFEPILVKNRHVGRTYTSPERKKAKPEILDMTRQELCRLKLIPLQEYVEGKRVVLTEDSIVRGNVSPVVTKIMRDAGAREVHFRVAYPPVRYPCFTGMDHARRKDLIAAPFEDLIEAGDYVARHIGADSVRYTPEEDVRRELGGKDNLCFACVNGDYWVDIPDTEHFRNALDL